MADYSLPVHLFVVYNFKRVNRRQVHKIGLMRPPENSCFSHKLLLLHAVFLKVNVLLIKDIKLVGLETEFFYFTPEKA